MLITYRVLHIKQKDFILQYKIYAKKRVAIIPIPVAIINKQPWPNTAIVIIIT